MNLTVFDKVDSYYENRDKKEFIYTILAIVLGVGFVIFYFIVPKASSFATSNEKKIHKFQGELKQSTLMLNGFRAQNIRIQKKLKSLKEKLITLNKKRVFYSQLVDLLDFARFNKEEWAAFVKTSIIDAKKMGLEVESVKNLFIDEGNLLKRIDLQIISLKRQINNISNTIFIDNGNKQTYLKEEVKLKNKIQELEKEKNYIKQYTKKSLAEKMIFGLYLKGSYKNFIYFMYQYENKKPLIRIDNFKIKPPNKYYIEIHLYGYKL